MNGKPGTEKRAAEKPFLPSISLHDILLVQTYRNESKRKRSKQSYQNKPMAPKFKLTIQQIRFF